MFAFYPRTLGKYAMTEVVMSINHMKINKI